MEYFFLGVNLIIYREKAILNKYSFNQIVYNDIYKFIVIIQIVIAGFLIYKAIGKKYITSASLFGGKAFDQIIDMTNQCIILTDRFGNIVYQNSVSENTKYIRDFKLDIHRMENNFIGNITIDDKYYGKKYIKQKLENQVRYYFYDKIKLVDKNRDKGYIITI